MTDDEMNEVDDPTPRVVVMGAGPIGLEAALYARYLGYEVRVFEAGRVADHVQRWGHVQMFTPFRQNRSPLGIAALRAQRENIDLPGDDELLTGHDFAQRYLIPLAESDLLAGNIFEATEVVQVGRGDAGKHVPADDREDHAFQILIRRGDVEEIVEADFVLDTTGTYRTPLHLGPGGIPAIGEVSVAAAIHYQVPDVLGVDRSRFENRKILLIGSGFPVAATLAALAKLQAVAPQTQIHWLTFLPDGDSPPIARVPDDPFPLRDAMISAANRLVDGPISNLLYRDQTTVLAVSRDQADCFHVTFAGKHAGKEQFDAIIAHVGFRPDTSLYAELQIESCSVTQRPNQAWCSLHVDADQELAAAQYVHDSEPDFFILGSKSSGRNANFLISDGLDQVRKAFAIIGDRADLDLYKTMAT